MRRSGQKRKTYHHGKLRQALVDAALEIIAAEGPEKLSLRDVARRSGVSTAAPYRHFADKDALLAAVAGECFTQLGHALDAAIAQAGSDPIKRFRASGIAYVRFAVERPAQFRAMNLRGVVERMPAQGQAAVEAWKESQREELARAQRRGLISNGDVNEILLAANCLMRGLAQLIVYGQTEFQGTSPEQAEHLARSVARVFDRGLLPRDAKATNRAKAKRGKTARARS